MDYDLAQIAEIYDAANPWSPDLDFYLRLIGPHPADVLDVGCGTGTLCCALAQRGHRVTGVEPAAAMLDIARRKSFANQVEWIHSSAQDFQSAQRFDWITITGHAFQVLLTDAGILAAFANLRSHVKSGGKLAFETRNPTIDWAREWNARATVVHTLPNGEQCSERLEVLANEGDQIRFNTHYSLAHKTLTTESTLRFLSPEPVEVLLLRSGMHVASIFGDWDGNPFNPDHSREIIFLVEAQ